MDENIQALVDMAAAAEMPTLLNLRARIAELEQIVDMAAAAEMPTPRPAG